MAAVASPFSPPPPQAVKSTAVAQTLEKMKSRLKNKTLNRFPLTQLKKQSLMFLNVKLAMRAFRAELVQKNLNVRNSAVEVMQIQGEAEISLDSRRIGE